MLAVFAVYVRDAVGRERGPGDASLCTRQHVHLHMTLHRSYASSYGMQHAAIGRKCSAGSLESGVGVGVACGQFNGLHLCKDRRQST